MHTETIEYHHGDTVLEAVVVWDDSIEGPRPGILVAHDWTGRRGFAISKAEEIAKQGYVGFALDMYGKGIFGADGDVAKNSGLMAPLAEDRQLLRDRMNAALDAIKTLPVVDDTKIGAMGYCFGGMCVLELARGGADALGVISIHGIFSPGSLANAEITAKVLCLHGHDDPMVPPEQVVAFEAEMSDSNADWQVHAYGGTMHAFTNPAANDPGFGTMYNPDADRRATQSIKNFFDELFS